MSQPLRSAPTPASRDFTATTGWSAGERRIGTQCLRLLPRHPPSLRPGGCTSPRERQEASTPAFSRSVREPQTRLTPPPRRAPPGQYSGSCQARPGDGFRIPSFDATSFLNDASTATPVRSPVRALLGRLPGPHLTHLMRRFLSLTTTVFSQHSTGWFDACPEGRRRRAAPPSLAQHRLQRVSYMSPSFSVRDTRTPGGLLPLPLTRPAAGTTTGSPRRNDDRVPQEERRPGPPGGTASAALPPPRSHGRAWCGVPESRSPNETSRVAPSRGPPRWTPARLGRMRRVAYRLPGP